MMSLILKLLLAHTLGDFVLQPDKWVAHKRANKAGSQYLYWHTLIHAILITVVLGFQMEYWPLILLVSISHYLIDLVKLYLENDRNRQWLFATDQLAHLLVIALATFIYEPYYIDWQQLHSKEMLLLALAIISLTSVSAVLMRMLMSTWEIAEDNNKADYSLPKAGKYIGILERLFVFGFILLNQWQAIGLLIAAKSVFRFSDLSRAKDRKLTEYILIGTLLSFGLAIVIGLSYQYLIS